MLPIQQMRQVGLATHPQPIGMRDQKTFIALDPQNERTNPESESGIEAGRRNDGFEGQLMKNILAAKITRHKKAEGDSFLPVDTSL